MSIDDLKNVLGNNKVTKYSITAAEVSNIMQYTNVSLELDRGTLDYFYSIDVQSLLDSDMPVADLDDLKKQGWAFVEDDKYLILYI